MQITMNIHFCWLQNMKPVGTYPKQTKTFHRPICRVDKCTSYQAVFFGKT